jgi:hypothetical protein
MPRSTRPGKKPPPPLQTPALSAPPAAATAATRLYATDTAALGLLLRRNGWDAYRHWCLSLLLLLSAAAPRTSGSSSSNSTSSGSGSCAPSLHTNLLRDPCVLSDKDAFITAVRTAA